ncbi:MAG: hypothetical protein HY043_09145 [Verrucomicrobia bacterium]|nr:hypothetical protein [Verrucomicrobiota bacterium]
MSDNTPNPPAGAVPPKPSEAAKVQPKKETVRINLPPKPSAAPTVRLPSPSSAGVAAPSAAVAAPVASQPAAATSAAPAPAAAKAPAPPRSAAPSAAPVSAAPRPFPTAGVAGLDKALAVVAALLGLAVAGWVIFLSMNS